MYHSITIGTNLLNGNALSKNTWSDWHLIPTSRPLVNPPTPNINRIPIPGGDGSLDVTDVLAGRPTYSDRTGSWSFYVENGFKQWSFLYSEIMQYLHGKLMQCVLEDDPMYYYEGRFSVNEWRSDASRSMITINYILSPYKMINTTGESWFWDTLYFGNPDDPSDDGELIRSYRNLKVNAGTTKSVTIDETYGGCSISVYTDTPYMTFTYKGKTYTPVKGKYTHFDNITLSGSSANTFVFRYTIPSGANSAYYKDSATFSIYISGGIL